MKIIILFQIAAGVCYMLTHRYIDGAVDFGGAFLGLMMFGSNAEDNGYSMQSTLCFLSFAFVFLFWSLTRGVFYFMGKDQASALLSGWQADVYQGALIGDVVIYFFMTILAYLLYSEMRRTLDDITNLAQFLHATDGSPAYQRVAQEEAGEEGGDVESGTASTDKPYNGHIFRINKK